MKTSSIYRPVLALMLLCLPGITMAQGDFKAKQKSPKPANTSVYDAAKPDIPGRSGTADLRAASTRESRLKSALNAGTSSGRVLMLKDCISVNYSTETGLPIFIQTLPGTATAVKSTDPDPSVECFRYLNRIKPMLKVERPEDHFIIRQISTDRFGKTHIRLDQVYKGIPVYGGDVAVHLNEAGEGESFNGRYFPVTTEISTIPAILSEAAIRNAALHLSKDSNPFKWESVLPAVASQLKPESSLVIYRKKDAPPEPVLAYQVTLFAADLHRWEYFINASDGSIIYCFDNTLIADGPKTATATDLNGYTRTLNTYLSGSSYYLLDISKDMWNNDPSTLPDDPQGGILTLDMQNTYGDNQKFYYITSSDNSWTNSTSVSAHYNAGIVYDYYLNTHQRNSIDDKKVTMISIINVPDPETGQPYDNAFWNGRFVCYGNGDVAFTPLAGALDVAGHEMTHGVVENTANLEYDGESGAINESMADVFGAMIENDDWLIGEDIVNTEYFPTGCLRDMSDPHNGGSSLADNGWQPNHMDEKYTGSEDNHGVHINSGIPNYAYYLLATAIGRDEAAAIFYKTLSEYLTKSSQFIDLRLAVIQAATDIHGAGSEQVTQAGAAFDAVGISDGQGSDVDPTLPENPGDEYLLVYNTDPADNNTLYRSNLGLDELVPLSTTPFYSRPSVSDNGDWAVFVADDDSTMHGIVTLPGYGPDESVVQSQHMWSNAVLSKDGNRIAGVSAWADTTIWVYDYATEVWRDFTLYNPTYTEGVEGSGVLYADALEFDYTGEFLVYDAFNSIKSGEGDNIEYWDVNFIQVWDNEANTFGDGTIYKLFSSIPDGVSIGDPTFSKNSASILAFDYWNSATEEYAILGVNIEENVVTTLVDNNMIGWPSFNKEDTRIAYTSATADNYEINYIGFNANEISSDGTVYNMFTGGAWPIYYSIGERPTGIEKTQGNPAGQEIISYPNPFRESISIEIPGEGRQQCSVEIRSQTGQVVHSGNYAGSNTITLDLKKLASGCYFLRLKNDKYVFSGKIIKTE
jgi:bacillolysin